jgi:hypothetical protein
VVGLGWLTGVGGRLGALARAGRGGVAVPRQPAGGARPRLRSHPRPRGAPSPHPGRDAAGRGGPRGRGPVRARPARRAGGGGGRGRPVHGRHGGGPRPAGAGASRATGREGPAAPVGWLGKTPRPRHGSVQGQRPPWILFTDADVVFEPTAVACAVRYGERRNLDHLAVAPHLQVRGMALECLLASFALAFVQAAPPWHVRAGRWPGSWPLSGWLSARTWCPRAGPQQGSSAPQRVRGCRAGPVPPSPWSPSWRPPQP